MLSGCPVDHLTLVGSAPDTKVVLHHVHKDVGLNAHSLVHLYITSTQVKAGSAPWHMFDSTRAASTAAMLVDWNLLLWDISILARTSYASTLEALLSLPPILGGGGPWLQGV